MNNPTSVLTTGIRNVRNVSRYIFGKGCISDLSSLLEARRKSTRGRAVFFIDRYFKQAGLPAGLNAILPQDEVIFVETQHEPTTDFINSLRDIIYAKSTENPVAIVGIGGGITMDTAKAVSNLLTNGGKAAQYQGWDLVKVPGIFKIGIPTISGTGAESTRTCVLINEKTGLKLGMNSDHTVFDQVVLDPELTATVPREQYLYTGMDAFIHSIESMAGSYRNPVGDAYSRETIALCQQVFQANDMMSSESREKLMVASYLGGCAIATSYVGLVHPFSAGLSVVLGLHHCVANCIALRALAEYYPEASAEFEDMLKRQNVSLPGGVCSGLNAAQFQRLFESTVIHEKPITNALGTRWRDILTLDTVTGLFKKM
jgi:3-deoxy-alpha-D-manno-octulosonate 8-oxidase